MDPPVEVSGEAGQFYAITTEPRRLILATSFERAFKALSEEIQDATREAIEKFAARSDEDSLRPGYEEGLRARTFRVNDGYRVIYRGAQDSEGRLCSELIHVGPHDDYSKHSLAST